MGRVLCVVIGVMAAASALAAASPVERVAATRVPEAASAVRTDGELNDAFWQTVPAITGFRQRDPREGAPPTFQTEARVAYDATTLYVSVQAFDPEPRRIVGIRTRRDEGSHRGTFQFSKDFGGVFAAPARNVFLIKWAYWLNY